MIAAATVDADKKVKKRKSGEKAREMRSERAIAIRLILKGMQIDAERAVCGRRAGGVSGSMSLPG